MRALALWALASASCAAPASVGSEPPVDLAAADLQAAPDLGCPHGTPDNCGACGLRCPPGADDRGTARTCHTPTGGESCGIACKADFYDVDGDPATGCEQDDAPARDTPQTAIAVVLPDNNLPNENPRNLGYPLYSDARDHLQPPTRRDNGRDNWFAVTVQGAGLGYGMQACLSINSFPQDDVFEVCLSDEGLVTFDPSSCAMVTRAGGSMCVFPRGRGNAGSYAVRVRKLLGAPSTNHYALFLQH